MDDIIVTSNSDSLIQLFISTLNSQFALKYLSPLNFFFGIKVVRSSPTLILVDIDDFVAEWRISNKYFLIDLVIFSSLPRSSSFYHIQKKNHKILKKK